MKPLAWFLVLTGLVWFFADRQSIEAAIIEAGVKRDD